VGLLAQGPCCCRCWLALAGEAEPCVSHVFKDLNMVLASAAAAAAAAVAAILLLLLLLLPAGPSDLKAAFGWCYDLAGRTPSPAASSNPFSSIFSSLGGLLGGTGSSSSGSSSSNGSSRGSSSGRAANVDSSRRQERDSFPPEDVKVLQGLDDLLLRFKVVYDNAEEREDSSSRTLRSSKSRS